MRSPRLRGARLGLIVTALVSMSFGCAPNSETETKPAKMISRVRPPIQGTGRSFNTGPILVGIVEPQSGAMKLVGEETIAGAELFAKVINAKGGVNGRPIRILVQDSASQPEQARSAATKLLSDGVIAIIGDTSSGNTMQIIQAAYPAGVPVISPESSKTKLGEEGEHFVRVCFTDDFQGPVMAKFAYEELGLRRMVVVTDNKQPYSQGLTEAFKTAFERVGGKILSEAVYETGQSDFTGVITEIKALDPDGLFLSGYYSEVGPFAQQVRAAGMSRVQFLGGDGWSSKMILRSGGKAILGSFICTPGTVDDPGPRAQAFRSEWKKYRRETLPTTIGAWLGYDAMGLLVDALKRSKAYNTRALIAALNDTVNYPGITGDLTLRGQSGNPLKPATVAEIYSTCDSYLVARKRYQADEIAKITTQTGSR